MSKKAKGKIEKLVSLCVLSMMFFMMFSPVPSFMFIAPAEAAFSSVTITDVTPTELYPGDTKEVTVTVENNGGRDAKDIRLAFQGTEIVSLVGPTVAQINTLNSWCSKEVKITVHVKDNAPAGTYCIPITCDWYEPTTKTVIVGYITRTDPTTGITETIPQTKTEYDAPEPRTAQLGISFNLKGDIIINVANVITDPKEIRPGDNYVTVSVAIDNSGEAGAKDVKAELIGTDGFKPSASETDTAYIGRLDIGVSKQAVFHIDIEKNIESKTYVLPMKITYRDSDIKEYVIQRELKLLVEPKPDFMISSFFTKPENITAGDHVTFYIEIENTGSGNAKSVDIRAIRKADQPFDFVERSNYIGDLDVGGEGTGILTFDVDGMAEPKAYLLNVRIRCTGDPDIGDDNVYTFDKTIKINVQPGIPHRIQYIRYGMGILALLVVIVSVYLFMGRKKERT